MEAESGSAQRGKHEVASARLRRRGDRTDFSDLMQALLEAWLATPE